MSNENQPTHPVSQNSASSPSGAVTTTKGENELLPCPFCGEPPQELDSIFGYHIYSCKTSWCPPKQSVPREKWNKRARSLPDAPESDGGGVVLRLRDCLSEARATFMNLGIDNETPLGLQLRKAAGRITKLFDELDSQPESDGGKTKDLEGKEPSCANTRVLQKALKAIRGRLAMSVSWFRGTRDGTITGNRHYWWVTEFTKGQIDGNIAKCIKLAEDALSHSNAAGAAKVEGGGWQPIETAPVNQSVLVFIPGQSHYGHGVYRALRPNFGTLRPWQVTGFHMGRDCPDNAQPTHWMPLPDAPSVPGGTEEQLTPPVSPKPSTVVPALPVQEEGKKTAARLAANETAEVSKNLEEQGTV